MIVAYTINYIGTDVQIPEFACSEDACIFLAILYLLVFTYIGIYVCNENYIFYIYCGKLHI